MPKKEVSKNDKKEKKENKHFFKDFKAELKRVIWPTPKQLVNNTVAVIVIVLIPAGGGGGGGYCICVRFNI